jgi:mono/diheme cytochrome c family protein
MSPKHDDTHPAQERENADPHERILPIPLAAVLVTLAMVLFGVIYIFISEPFGNAGLGDRRSVADLSGPVPSTVGAAVDGKAVFTAQCVACHQATGRGLPGVFPPLDGSEWVQGDPRTIANILLHGINGEISVAGTTYNGAMPAFKHLGDAELAAVASYIRSNWSNHANSLPSTLFEQERKASSTRTQPFEGGAALKALSGQSK